jgi:hypothetical protein
MWETSSHSVCILNMVDSRPNEVRDSGHRVQDADTMGGIQWFPTYKSLLRRHPGFLALAFPMSEDPNTQIKLVSTFSGLVGVLISSVQSGVGDYKTAIKRLLAAVQYNFNVSLEEGSWHQFRASINL